MRLTFTLFLLCFLSGAVATAQALQHFVPGTYVLREGDEQKCRTGEFMIYDEEGPKIALGAYHIFSLINRTERIADNLRSPGECYYDAQDSFEALAKFSLVGFKEIYSCGGQVRHVLDRRAKIWSNRVELEVVQEGTPNFRYRCVWLLNRRAINSAPAKKPASPATSEKGLKGRK